MSKPAISINFSNGLNLKVDDKQIPLGQFAALENSVFQIGGLMSKRPGYGKLVSLSPNNYITTLNNNLISIGNTVSAYSSSLKEWITKGTLQPCSLNVLPLIRNNLNQVQADCAIANNLVCTVFTETNNSNTATVTQYLYAIADATTGQNIVQPSTLPVISGGAISGSSRVYVVGNYFVIVSQVIVSSTTSLQYVSIPISNPVNTTTNAANVSAAVKVISEVYVPISSNPGWDAVVNGTNLVVAYYSTTGAQGVHVALLTVGQIAAGSSTSTVHQFNNSAYIGALVSICCDTTTSPQPNIFYISFWNNSTQNGYTCAVYINGTALAVQFTPQQIISSVAIVSLASAAQNGSCLVFDEVVNNYGYDSSIETDYITGVTVSNSGTVGSPYVVVRSVGLASKAFIVNGKIYFLSTYASKFQSTYFLINGSTSTSSSPIIVGKLAYENGGGSVLLGLPNAVVDGNTASFPYLYKDDIEALNTLNNTSQTTAGGIYSQTGINLASFELGTQTIDSSEIANNLHISGGYLSHFDGYLPVEHNFFLFPDYVECAYTETSTVTPTGTTTSGSAVITAVSSVSGVFPGMTITGTAIPSGATVVFVGTTTITISAAATGNHSSETLTIQGNIAAQPDSSTNTNAYAYQAIYEWTDNQGLPYYSAPSIPVFVTTISTGAAGSIAVYVPTLRLTAKVANKVKITIYRWSVQNQVYQQVTSITSPVLNDPTVDYVEFVDNLPDSQINGNSILYTTGGVVPDCNAPACNGIMGLFNSSLVMMNAENPNEAWISKTVVPGVPVEMSQDFTIFVSPTQGVQKSLGSITACAPMDDKFVFFFGQGASYINGSPPPITGATSTGCSLGNYSQPISIASSVGCTNQQSIVMTSVGLMFQSDKGIWLLNRFNLQTSYVGAPVEKYNSSTVMSAAVIPKTTYVLFTLNTGEILMYDYYYDQWGTFNGVPAQSSCVYQNLHTVLDQYGNILQETPGVYLDNANPVLMKFKTGWINIASVQGFERFYWFYLLGQYLSPHILQAGIAYNYNPSIVSAPQIDPQNFSSSVPSSFGDQPAPWGSPSDLEQWLVHSKYQKCQSFQISVQEVFNPLFGTAAGPGLTISGLNIVALVKRGSRPIAPNQTTG